MSTIELQPAEPLRAYIHKIVRVEFDVQPGVLAPLSPRPIPGIAIQLAGGKPLETVDLRGRVRIAPRAVVIGPQTRCNFYSVGTGRVVALNIMFRPTGFYRLFNQSLTDITDSWHDAEDVLGRTLGPLVDAIVEQTRLSSMKSLVEGFLLARLPASRAADVATHVAAVVAGHAGYQDLRTVVEACGIGERQLQRLFLREVGMTPKRFECLVRFRKALQLKASTAAVSWTQVAQEVGYYDQNHLVKNFRELTGVAPSAYLNAIAPHVSTEMFESR
jgi:AraC-like DNA-binding protein